MSNEFQYKIGSCPLCKQGYLEVVKEQDTCKLFILCDECEAEWENPQDALQFKNGFRFKYGKVIEPTFDEISNLGWNKYLVINKR